MKAVPKIEKYMSANPYAINVDATLEEASEVMYRHKIHHLPVLHGKQIRGLLTERELQGAMNLIGVNPKKFKVSDLTFDEPYVTRADATLSDVAAQMAENNFTSAVVTDNDRLVGIFTSIDACRALSEICESRFHR